MKQPKFPLNKRLSKFKRAAQTVYARIVDKDFEQRLHEKELLQELQVHQIELEMQNEQLRLVQLDLEESRDAYVDLYDFAPVGYLTLNSQGLIIKANLAAGMLLGEDRNTLQMSRFSRYIDSKYLAQWNQAFASMIKKTSQRSELVLVRNDKSQLTVAIHGRAMVSDEHLDELRLALSDISAQKKIEEENQRLAYYDPLTNLPNRRLLMDRLNQALITAARSRHFGAVMFLDLDNFKLINDTRGHDIGDMILIEVANRLQSLVRKSDTVARMGGDEFVIILGESGNTRELAMNQATHMGEKICQLLREPYPIAGTEFLTSASVGIALFQGSESADHLMKQSDLAMYQVKSRSRNSLCFFDPAMQIELIHRIDLIQDLKQAISRNQLELYFQPQFDMQGCVVGVESLVRWTHANLGLLLPDRFIPLAEETGMIVPIGQWVMMSACLQLKRWQAFRWGKRVKLTVNVSALEFRQNGFVEPVRHVLAATDANPCQLSIELTETRLLQDIQDTQEKMNALKAMGISLSMDDFGIGYSSLSNLARLPFDQLKIDKSFVQFQNHEDEIMVQAIISMGHNLGLSVVAEGVETKDQVAFLSEHHCPILQGNLLSLPLKQQAFEDYLSSHDPCPSV